MPTRGNIFSSPFVGQFCHIVQAGLEHTALLISCQGLWSHLVNPLLSPCHQGYLVSWFVFRCCDEHHDPKAVCGGKVLVHLIACFPSIMKGSAGSSRLDPGGRNWSQSVGWGRAAYWLAPRDSLSSLCFTTRDHLSRHGTTHSRMSAFSYLSLIKKYPHRLTYQPVW